MKALAGYVQAIPIFTSADEAVKKYFTEHRSEINDETGKHIIVLVAEEIQRLRALPSALERKSQLQLIQDLPIKKP